MKPGDADGKTIEATSARPESPTAPLRLLVEKYHNRARILAGLADPVTVHDFRVSSRRLLIGLEWISPVSEGEDPAGVIEILRRGLAVTSVLSDLQVKRKAALARLDEFPALQSFIDFQEGLEAEMTAEIGTFAPAADEVETIARVVGDKLARLESLPPSRMHADLADAMHAALKFRRRRAARALRTLKADDVESVHELRIALRKLRYHIEFSRPFYGDPARAAVEAAKEIQTLAGDVHDLDILTAALKRYVQILPQAGVELLPLLSIMADEQDEMKRRLTERAPVCLEVMDPIRSRGKPGRRRADASMVRLVLLRHASAVPSVEFGQGDDDLRPLIVRGRREAREAGRRLARMGITFDRILASPTVRTLQTARIAADAMGIETEVRADDRLKGGGDKRDLIESLARVPAPWTVLLVGHEPDMSGLTSMLLCGRLTMEIDFRKAAVVLLASHELKWGAGMTLEGFFTPGDGAGK